MLLSGLSGLPDNSLVKHIGDGKFMKGHLMNKKILVAIIISCNYSFASVGDTSSTKYVTKNIKSSTKYCAGEEIPNKNLACAYDLGILPNTNKDSSEVLKIALETIPSSYEGIFFPAGKYKFDKDIVLFLSNRHSIIGSLTYKTVFYHEDANGLVTSIGNGDFGPTVINLTIQNIIFDNIRLNFYGHKKYMTIKNNAFINTGFSYDAGKKEKGAVPQIALSHYPSSIIGNVLMRSEKTPGLGIRSYRNGYYETSRDLLIEGNFLGNLEEKDHARLYISNETKSLIDSLRELRDKGVIEIKGDQGNFVTGWIGDNEIKRTVFKRNYIAGNKLEKLYNPNTNKYDWVRDHIVYLSGYDGVDVVQNYFSGWPASSNGMVKFRNAENLVFAANYLNNTNLDARAYDAQGKMFLNNTYIFNNYVTNGIINYWQNCTNADNYPSGYFDNTTVQELKDLGICLDSSKAKPGSIQVKNYLVFNNMFKKVALDKGERDVSALVWLNRNGEFFSSTNLATDATMQQGKASTYGGIVEIPLSEIQAKVPYDKHEYFNYQVLGTN